MRMHRLGLLILLLWLSAACGNDSSGTTPPDATAHDVTVAVTTSGEQQDADGYTVTMDGRSLTVGANGSVTFEDVEPGTYEVRLTGVAENCEAEGGSSRSATVTSSSGAQVAFTVVCEPDFVDEFETVACPALSPAAVAGVPGERVAVGAVPADFEPPLIARALTEEGSAVSNSFLAPRDGEDDVLELVLPVHPSLDAAGGEVVVRVTDGTKACAPFTLTVEPLPPSPGELHGLVQGLQELVRLQAAILGTTPEELVATPVDQLPPELVPLAVVQSVVDHPQNENSLAAIAAGTAPAAAGLRLDLLEPLLAGTGVRDMVESTVSASASYAPYRISGASQIGCDPLAIGNSAALLHGCMVMQASAAFRLQGTANAVIKKIMDTLGVVAFVPALGTATTVAGSILWAAINLDARTAAMLPSTFTTMTLLAAPLEFLEDTNKTGSWIASVTAENSDWDMGKEFIEALLQGAALAGTLDKADVTADLVASTLAGAASGPAADQLLAGGTLEDFKIEKKVFGPVNVSDEEWSEARILGDAVTLSPSDHTVYMPALAGTATLSVRTEDGMFGGNQIAEQKAITVHQLDLDITPEDVFVEPDGVQSFVVTVQDSEFPEAVAIDPAFPMQGSAEITYRGGNIHDIIYVAPADPDVEKPDQLVVYHTATSGARANGGPRRASATIRFGDLDIVEPPACVDVGETVAFEAELESVEGDRVLWSTDLGEIDETTGVYTATDPGVATIRGRSEAIPQLEDEVTLQVGSCTCSWSLTVDGVTVESEEGDWAGFLYTEQGVLSSVTLFDVSADQGASISPEGPNYPSGPGAFIASVSGRIGAGDLLYVTPDTPLDLVIDAWDPGTTLIAAVAGWVDMLQTGSSDPVKTAFLEASFRIHDAAFVTNYLSWACTVPPGGSP